MPSSRILIASNTLTTSAASVTFSSIPNTYTDLVLRVSARSTRSDRVIRNLQIQANSDTATNYSTTWMSGSGSVASSSRSSSATFTIIDQIPAGLTTSNTFSNTEIYIPSYNASQNKPMSSIGNAENNSASDWYITASANLWRNTAVISSILIFPESDNLASGSSFFLYGIKNS